MAGAGKEGGGAANKRIESLEGAMGMVHEKLDSQALQFQHQADVNAGIEQKLGHLVLAQEELTKTINQLLRGKDAESSGPKSGLGGLGGGSTPPTPPIIISGAKFGPGGGSGHLGGGSGSGTNPPFQRMSFGSFGDEGRGRYEYRHRKIDMPTFDGTDPDGWILQAERYFAIYQLINEEKMEAAILSLQGDALAWFRWSNRQNQITNWEELKTLFLRKFRPIQGGDLYEQWSSLEQDGNTGDYIRRFIELAAPLDGVSDRVALGSFIKGLKPIIKNELRLWAPTDLGRAMDLAQQIEEKNRVIRSSGFGSLGFRSSTQLKTPNYPTTNTHQPTPNYKPGVHFRRSHGEDKPLTESQINNKRAKGLCYKCDERWFKGHQCKTQVNVILIEEDEWERGEETQIETKGEEQATLDSTEVSNFVEVSLNSVAGLSSPKTMKIKGTIMNQEVVTLIDPGATHNFLSLNLVTTLGLPICETEPYGVRMGTGDKEQGRGICQGIRLQLNDLEIVEEFLPLRLGSSDVILGMKWLETLGTTQTNWKNQTMDFEVDGRQVRLVGDRSLGKSLVTLRAMERELKRQGNGVLIELSQTEVKEEQIKTIPVFLKETLGRFRSLFKEPKGLPPTRALEHQIMLKEGTPPISVRPYRYPHIQKDEIERMIREMLTAGVIQTSTSPYSSPVILVKKKDGSWRFCVDYRALNRATIPDKFPIPVIDELLDELHGSTIFSKLDLRSGYHQIRVRAEDVHKTAFRTHDGHYEFKVMPFGLTNAPATFQALMNEIFRPYLRKFILVFFDDILIYSPNEETHKNHLHVALQLLTDHQLLLNEKKCEFGQRRLSYLGHEISEKGVSAEETKIKAMTEWATPRNIKELRGFLGLTGYYRKFVKGYSSIAILRHL